MIRGGLARYLEPDGQTISVQETGHPSTRGVPVS